MCELGGRAGPVFGGWRGAPGGGLPAGTCAWCLGSPALLAGHVAVGTEGGEDVDCIGRLDVWACLFYGGHGGS